MRPDPKKPRHGESQETENGPNEPSRLLLNCSRQAGKSTVVDMLDLAQAVFVPGTKVLLVSRSHRQSKELFGIAAEFYRRFNKPMLEQLTSEELRLTNLSRLVSLPCRGGRRVGGIDFGFRNPFAAVWGTLDRDDVLWLTGEHYARQKPLSNHAERLPPDMFWYADPSGATERCELRCGDLRVVAGINSSQLGIAAVTARLANGGLRVVQGACPNLLAEACL